MLKNRTFFDAMRTSDRPNGSRADCLRHWNALKADGITAAQFTEYLQTHVDLEGMSVSYADESRHLPVCPEQSSKY